MSYLQSDAEVFQIDSVRGRDFNISLSVSTDKSKSGGGLLSRWRRIA